MTRRPTASMYPATYAWLADAGRRGFRFAAALLGRRAMRVMRCEAVKDGAHVSMLCVFALSKALMMHMEWPRLDHPDRGWRLEPM
eukprot:scaffold21553_cov248-Isochrysis_galbana.AAC.2